MLRFYFRSAGRSLSRKKFFSFLNVAGLAIGICIFLLALEFHSYERGFNRWHAHLKDLYRVDIAGLTGRSSGTVPTIAPLMEQQIPGVHSAVRFADNFNDNAVVSYEPTASPDKTKAFREEGCVFVDPSFLNTFSFPLAAGSNDLSQTNTVLITASVARQFFGADKAVGKTLHLHNQFADLPVKIVGVLADLPAQSDIRFRYLFSIHILENPGYTEGSDWARLDSWGNNSYTTYVWLAPGTNPADVGRTATALCRKHDPDYQHNGGVIELQPVSEIHLGRTLTDPNPTYASLAMTWTILGLGILILCIAWINYINFSTADSLNRAKEIGIHKIIGGSRSQIALRYIAESLTLSLMGVLLAAALTQVVQGVFNYITERPLSVAYINNPENWLVMATVFFAGSLVSGGYVGLVLSRLKPVTSLHLNDKGKWGQVIGRKVLVVFQLTVSCLFTAGTLIAYEQIKFMKEHDLGMDIDRLVVINGPVIKDAAFKSNSEVFKNEVLRLPFVQNLSCTGSVPGVGFAHNFAADGITGSSPRKGDDRTNYFISIVDEQFFTTYHIPLLYGTDFTDAEAGRGLKGDALIVNETAARYLGYTPAEAVGKTVNWGRVFTIRAVVRDYHHRSLKDQIEPIVYVPGHSTECYTLKMDPGQLSAKLSTIGGIYKKLYPGNSFVYTPLREAYDRLYADEQRAGTVALCLSLLIIVIAGLGLVGLAAFTAKRRVKEMGIRKVLGASVGALFLQMSKEFLWLVVIALFIAMPVVWFAGHRWLEGFAFRIQPGWAIFVLTGVFSMTLTLLTVSYHALRTSMVNPVEQLRAE